MPQPKDLFQKYLELNKQEQLYKKKIDQIKLRKQALDNVLIKYIEKNNFTKKKFTFGNECVRYKVIKSQNGLSYKYIRECLFDHFNEDIDKVEKVIDQIKKHRTTKITKKIECGQNKKK